MLHWHAKYDDYGAGDTNTGAGLPYVMSGVQKHLIEKEVGENKYHDIEVKKEGFDLKKFYSAVHEGRLEVKDIFNDSVEVDFVMMRKDCVDALLNTWSIETSHYDSVKREVIYGSFDYDDLLEEIPEYLAALKKAVNGEVKEKIDFQFNRRLEEAPLVSSHLDDSMMRQSRFVNVRELVFKLAENDDYAQAESILTDYLRGSMISALFEHSRRIWAPGAHEGSQCTDTDGHLAIIGVTQEAIEREEKEMEEEY